MKRIFTAVFLLTTVAAGAQNHAIGIKGGLNSTEVVAKDLINDPNPKLGFSGGLTYQYRFSKHFYVGADLLYQQRGFTTEMRFADAFGPDLFYTVEMRYNYNYLALPLKAGFEYGETIFGFINVAAVPARLVSANHTIPERTANGRIVAKEVYKARSVTRFDFASLAEIGVGYRFNKRYSIFAAVAFQQSFTSITNDQYFAGSAIKHTVFAGSLGLKYTLGK